jgi:hypothetical protein
MSELDAGTDAPPSTDGQRRYRLRLTKVTSFVVFTQQRTATFAGTVPELHDRYRRVLAHNVAFGWWGIPAGVIWTPVALWTNSRALRRLDEQVAPPATAARGPGPGTGR